MPKSTFLYYKKINIPENILLPFISILITINNIDLTIGNIEFTKFDIKKIIESISNLNINDKNFEDTPILSKKQEKIRTKIK